MMASVFGAKVAEDIFPEPVKSRIRKAVDTQLAVNNPDFLDTTYIKALIVASGVKVDIDPDIFRVVFEAWQKRHSIEIKYKSPDGAVSVREIEPHVLTYYNEAWYIKGFCLKSNAPRVFAIHRIKSAEMTDKTFEPDLKIVESVIDGEVFSFDKIKDVDVWLDTESAKYSKERKCKKGETIKFNKDGSAIIHFDEVAKAEIVRWVMSECGRAKVVKPPSLVKEISAAAAAISKLHPK